MSIQIYNKSFTWDNEQITEVLNPNGTVLTAASNPATPESAMTGDYEVTIAVRRTTNGKIMANTVPFTMVAKKQYSAANAEEMDNEASKVAAMIAWLSRGVQVGFKKKLGKYRNDEMPGILKGTEVAKGYVMLSNNKNADKFNTDDCVRFPSPKRSAKVFIRIPYIRSDVSRADIWKAFKKWTLSNTGSDAPEYILGKSVFHDTNKKILDIFPMECVAGGNTRDDSKPYTFGLINDDTGEGITDHVLSEARTEALPSGADDFDGEPSDVD